MRQAEATSRRADSLGDIEEWMARRWADLERLGPEAEAAGRGAWRAATRAGRKVMAERPRDVTLLGARALSRHAEPSEAQGLALTEPEPLQKIAVVEPSTGPEVDAPQAMDLGLRFHAARNGDSISRLIGSSDPAAIGEFLSLNGMNGRDSTLRAGRSYVVPTHWDDATEQEAKVGQAILGADNARLRTRAEERAAAARKAELPTQTRTAGPVELFETWAQPRAQAAPSRGGGSLDNNPAAKTIVGVAGWGLGLVPGVARGGVNMVKGAAEGAYYLNQVANPLAPPNAERMRAGRQLATAARRGGEYVARAISDPSIVRDDIADARQGLGEAWDEFKREQNPFATPQADTLGGEFRRTFDIGMNNGELLFDAGSLVVGGGAVRGAAGLGKAAKAADAAETAYLARNPGVAAAFARPYPKRGMSHHIIERRAKLPTWLGGGAYPREIIESEFNKIRHAGISTRDLYRNHNGAAGHFHGNRVPAELGGGSWSAKDLGWTRYGPLDRLNHGTSPYTKAVLGPVLLGGTLTDWIDGEP